MTVDRAILRGLLGACFAGMFGLRRTGPGRRGFLAWARTLPPDLADAVAADERDDDARLAELASRGFTDIARDWETGHVPADHDSYLYDFGELVPALASARFEQWVSRKLADRDSREPLEGAYRLRCWLRGKRFETPAIDHGDYVDVTSIIGFLNALLATTRDDHRIVALRDGDTVLLGRREALAGARLELDIDDD